MHNALWLGLACRQLISDFIVLLIKFYEFSHQVIGRICRKIENRMKWIHVCRVDNFYVRKLGEMIEKVHKCQFCNDPQELIVP